MARSVIFLRILLRQPPFYKTDRPSPSGYYYVNVNQRKTWMHLQRTRLWRNQGCQIGGKGARCQGNNQTTQNDRDLDGFHD